AGPGDGRGRNKLGDGARRPRTITGGDRILPPSDPDQAKLDGCSFQSGPGAASPRFALRSQTAIRDSNSIGPERLPGSSTPGEHPVERGRSKSGGSSSAKGISEPSSRFASRRPKCFG